MISGLGSETSDDYLMEEATKANNSRNYDYALEILTTKISSSAKTTVKAKELLASAYAGKCGFNFAEYVENLVDSVGGTAFRIAMDPFVGVELEPAYCLQALQTMDTLGTPVQRTANQNTFTAITGMVMMGASLRAYSDATPAPAGDGTIDVNLCSGVTNDQMDDVIVGYGYFATNFAYVSAALVGSSSFGSLQDVINICNGMPGGVTCTITNKTDITGLTRDTFRDIINTVEFGVGSYVCNDDVLQIPASCP
jgi:hypothetical protein